MAKQGYFSEHWTDANDRPAGGISSGRGFAISWQNGPLGRGNKRREPNGAFVEDVIDTVIDRIRFYNDAGFSCDENIAAIAHLAAAAEVLDSRNKRRETAGVEGTHERA